MATSSERGGRGAAIQTFLIADIRGYTRFTAQHGDEAASRLASQFAQIAAEGIEAWGGELVELRGDEALAVFGSARQALRAAVELQSAFRDETNADPALPMPVGIGLDAGEAVPVGEGYRGAALNMAARLCSLAGPGEVIASQGLMHLAGRVEGLDRSPTEPIVLKGYDEPVVAVKVSGRAAPQEAAPAGAGARAASTSLPPELDPIVPLAGRERELLWLRWHWRRARHGHGRAVVLSGLPGIGKTRLAAELATVAHEAGARIAYVPAARLAPGSEDLHADPSRADPLLTVIDDLDAAPAEAARSMVALSEALVDTSQLLLVTHRLSAPPQLIAIAERLAPAEQRRTVGPVDADAVRAIVALYAGRSASEAPIEALVGESGGVPAAVHRVASQWARRSAEVRLGASADRTAAGRSRLRDAEGTLVDDVADLELARERARLYAASDGDADGGPATSRTICPYKGLAEFEAADADHYFGRERLVAELIARSVGGTFLGLVGDSGSGKSSALRAGLLPALAAGVLPGSDTWPQALLRPGEQPVAELRRALVRALPNGTPPPGDASAILDAALAGLATGQRLVVVVDQFEEVFNATRDEAQRSAFIELLTTERPGLKVIVAMRADHYGRCAAYPALARLLGSNQVLVGPLSSAELAAVIEHPAQRVGLRVEPDLTAALVADAGSEPGVLPLLSTTLLELWGAREAGRLTLAAYRAAGGLQGSIARLAEATYAGLDPHRQHVARALLLRLAGPGEGSELVRRRVSLDELDADADPTLRAVLGTLTEARLLTTGDGHVEVAHEALLREWPRLQGWLAEDAAGRQVRLHLIGAVRDWQARGRESSDLYRGARLAAALDWAAEHPVELNASERAFLDDSRAASERAVEHQRRTNRRLRVLLGVAAIALIVAVGAGALAAIGRIDAERSATEAERSATEAERSATAAEAQRLGAQALTEKDLDISLLLARQGVALDDSLATRANLLSALDRSPAAIGAWRPPVNGRPQDVSVSPDGRHLLVDNNQRPRHAFLIDAGTGQVLRDIEAPSAFASDGTILSFPRGDPRTIQVSSVDSPTVTRTVTYPEAANGMNWAFAPDLSTISFIDPDYRGVTVLDPATGSVVRHLTLPDTLFLDVFQYADGTLLTVDHKGLVDVSDPNALDAVYGEPGVLHWWTADSDAPTAAIAAPAGSDGAGAVDVAHGLLALDEGGGNVGLYDLPGGARRDTGAIRHNDLVGMSFSPDGRSLVTTGDDGLLRVWDVTDPANPETLAGHDGRVFTPALSDAGGHLTAWSVGQDAQLIEWDLSGDRRLGHPIATDGPDVYRDGEPGHGLAVSPDGRLLAVTGADGNVRITDTTTLSEVKQLAAVAGGQALDVAFSPDGRTLAVAGTGDRAVETWDVMTWTPTGAPLSGPSATVKDPPPEKLDGTLPPDLDAATAVAFSPDGRWLAAGAEDGSIYLWDAATGAPDGQPITTGGPVYDIAFSPDSTQIAASYVDLNEAQGVAGVWGIADRQMRYHVSVDDEYATPFVVAFSPDGRQLVTGGGKGEVRFWDASTGAAIGRPVIGETGWVESLSFDPTGATVVSAGSDGGAHVIDVATHQQLGTALPADGAQNSRALWTPDGERLIVVPAVGQAVAWDLGPAARDAQACRIAGRTLTQDEWDRYLPGTPYQPACAGG